MYTNISTFSPRRIALPYHSLTSAAILVQNNISVGNKEEKRLKTLNDLATKLVFFGIGILNFKILIVHPSIGLF